METETWEVWYPRAAATGLLFARGRLDATDVLLVHAAPDVVAVEVRDSEGRRVASGHELASTAQSPICRLERRDGQMSREDIWPGDGEIGLPVLLHGGEVGILKSWWNAPDRKEWRWQIELYNSTRE
jgi:hypothetical protein